MRCTLFRTSGPRSLDRRFSIPFSRLALLSLARAVNRAVAARKPALPAQDAGCAEEHRVLVGQQCFSDVWKEAQRSRTAFARAYVKAIVRQVRRTRIRRALAQADLGSAPTRIGRQEL